MANTVISLKKSATPSAAPINLANGELAINYADGKLFYKAANGTISSISGNEPNYFGTVNANNTLVVADTPGDIFTIAAGKNIDINGDAVNDKLTVSLTNDVTITGEFFVNNSTGLGGSDEGGELKLANATSAISVLNGPIVVDIYQNKIRFFEGGSPNRGAFINLAAASASVGTDLLAAATSTDSLARATASQAFDKANAALPNVSGTWFNGTLSTSADFVADKILSTNNGNAENFKVGDDAWIGDTNIANAFRIKGQQNASIGYVMFGPNDGKLLGRAGTDSLTYDGNIIWHAGNSANASQAFDRANTANITADRAWNHANAAFANGNTTIQTAQSAFTLANISYAHANAAFFQANTADDHANLAFFQANTARVHANAAFANANTVMISTQAAFTVANSGFLHANASYAFANSIATTANLAFAHANAAFAHANAAFLSSNGVNTHANSTYVKLTAASQTITGNLNIVGDLTLSGNTIFIDATRLQIDDPLIYLAGNNYTSDIVDIGFIGNYVNATGQNVHTGLYREHLDKEYYLFQGYDKEPENNHIGALSNNMTLAVLNAVVKTSNLILGGANAILTIGAAFNQANAARTVVTDTVSANRFLVFANGTSGTFSSANVTTGLTFNPASNTLTTGSIILSGTGNPLIGTVQANNNFSAGLVIRKRGNPSDIDGSVLSGAELGYNSFFGWNGDGFVRGAYIIARTSEDWNNTNRGSRLSFATTDIGSNVNVERVTIDPAGNVLIGRTISTVGQNVKLDVNGAVNASAVLINGTPALANAAGITTAGGITVPGTIVLAGSPDGVRAGVLNYLGNTLIVSPNTADWKTSLRLISSNNATSPDIIIFYSNNNTSMFDARGNLLIGRTTSTVGNNVKLDVNGAVNASAVLINGAPALTGGITSNVVISVADNTNAALRITQTGTGEAIRVEDSVNPDATPFVVTASGEVGVGTATPFPLTTTFVSARDPLIASDGSYIGGGAYWDGATWRSTVASQGGWVIRNTSGQFALWTGYNSGAANTVPPVFAERLRVDGNGNIGIGTSFPASKLDVSGTGIVQARVRSSSTDGSNLAIFSTDYGNGSTLQLRAAPNYTYLLGYTPTSSPLYITSNSQYGIMMTMNHTGNVGIGTTAPSSILEVSGDVVNSLSNLGTSDNATITITNTNVGGFNRIAKTLYEIGNLPIASVAAAYTVFNAGSNIGGDLIFSTQRHVGTGVQERMRVDSAGNVFIGRTDSTVGQNVKLDVNGAINAAAVLVNGTPLTSGSQSNTFTSNVVISVADNTNAALRITQTGTGDAIRVEDSANPDSTPLVVDNAGRLVVGHTAATGGFPFGTPSIQTHSGSLGIARYNSTPENFAQIDIVKSANSTVAVHTILADTDSIGRVAFAGSDGTNFIRAVQINTFVDGTPSTGIMPGAITFATTGLAGSSPTERLRINSRGNVGINITSPTSRLHVGGTSNITSTAVFGSNVGIGISPDFPLHIALETGQTNILVDSYGTGVSSSSQLIGRRAGGTRTSPTATPANGAMLFLGARGHNGSSFATTSAAAVGIFAAEDWTSTAAGTYIDFRTTSIGTTTTSVRMIINANGNVGIGTTSPAYKLEVAGSFAAQTKSFVINHPTKPDMKLRYGSLEGPENGVYVRGRLYGQSIIELPEYWWNLIDEETITVNLTPIGYSQDLWVQSTSSHFIHLNQPAECFFTVFAERKDVDKLVVEF